MSSGLVDAYPAPYHDPEVSLNPAEVKALLGIEITTAEIARLLTALEFTCRIEGENVIAQTPPHRLDIGEGLVGKADLMEEIARLYSYNNIPETRMATELPPQRANPALEMEEQVRDILVSLGLQEVVTYRLTSPERERRDFTAGCDGQTGGLYHPQEPDRPGALGDAPQPAGLGAGSARAQHPLA